jgi:prevent-host-death family protein
MARTSKRPKRKRYDTPRGGVAKVSELKAGLSAYLQRVKRGEQVVITERGRSIAKLVPIPQSEDPEMERMRRLEREGRIVVHGDGRIPPEFWLYEPPPDPEGLVLKALLEERRKGR